MFYHQFHVTYRELRSIRRFTTFVALVYKEHWFRSPNSTSAPHNNLTLIKKLCKYREIDSEVEKCAEKATVGHLWYLSEHLVSVAFFSSEVASETKQAILEAFEKLPKLKALKRLNSKSICDNLHIMNLDDFVTQRSKEFFTLRDINLSNIAQLVRHLLH